MSRKYFGTDGIRGRANGLITPELALKVGQAAGLVFQRGEHRHRVVIGKDTRLSGYMIEYAMVAGFTSVGMDVLLLGPMPTPAVAMLTQSMRADLGVMISASHNLFEDNGIKLFGRDGFKLSDARRRSRSSSCSTSRSTAVWRRAPASAAPAASTTCMTATSNSPSARCRESSRSTACASWSIARNGAAYKVVPEALWELGADVIAIGVDPDGFNINKECGSTSPEALAKKVREMRADIGIALDGDADRVIMVDERGHVVDGDQLLAVIAQSWKDDGRLAKPGIVATVMSNLGLERFLEGQGLGMVRTPVGDRYVLEQMLKRRLQSRRRAVRPYHSLRLRHHRRRLRRSTAGAGRGAKTSPAGVGSLPPFRSAAADPQERALSHRQAARPCRGEIGDHGRRRIVSTATAGCWSARPAPSP